MIQSLLQQLGLTAKEADVYLAILQQGKIAHADIAKVTKINRTTVYAAVKELLKMGVIYEDKGQSVTYLLARSPEKLRIIVDAEKARLQKKEDAMQQAILELELLVKKPRYSVPKMTFIDENRLKDHLYSQAEAWNKSILETDGIWWGFQDPSFVEHFQDWIDWYWKESAPKELKLQLLSNDSSTEQRMQAKEYERRTVRFWEQSDEFTGTTWVNGDYVVMIITQQRPFYLIEIHDAVLAQNMRNVFKGIWKTLDK